LNGCWCEKEVVSWQRQEQEELLSEMISL
jgi:hypothetical protein